MRILFCNKYNFPFSGTEVYLFEVMNLLRSCGHEVALFSMEDARGARTPWDKYFVPPIDFKKPRQPLGRRMRLAAHAIYSVDARRRLRELVRAFQPDVAHVRNIYHHLSPSVLWELKAQGVPVLLHLNDFKVVCPTYNMVANGEACSRSCLGSFWKMFRQHCHGCSRSQALVLMAEAYIHHWLGTYRKCVDHFLAPSQFVQQVLIQNGFDPDRISVLPHFQRVPDEIGPPVPQAPIVYFGRLSAEKGIADLIRAMQGLPSISLKIAGDGPQRESLEDLTRDLALENVEFVGHLEGESLQQFVATSRFTVMPSRAYETFGKAILESYAWAKPVVATDLGSRRELVHDGETGILYPPGDVEALRSAVRQLAERPQLAEKMGSAGRRLAQDHYSPEEHYRSLLQLYEQVLSSVRPVVGGTAQHNPAPLRIAFIGGRGVISKYSGIESYYEEAGKRLAERGYELTVYCRSHFTPATSLHNGMRVVRFPTIRSKHLETVLHTLFSTIHAMFQPYDVVHFHALGPALFSFLPRWTGKKTAVTVQGLDWQRKKWGRLASFVLRLGESAAVRTPDATMVVSRTLQDYYRQHYQAETIYVPNGTLIRERSAPRRILEWGLQPDGYVLFLGRFSPEKNCHLLLEAFERLDTPAKLVFAGGSSHTDGYAERLRRHQSDRIVFLDWVSGSDLDELLTNAALFVLPSDLEGLSLALLDAMAAGLCVLVSDIPENREVVEDAGFTFHAGDVDDLARRLDHLLSNPQLRAETGKKAQQRIRDHYLWPGIARQIGAVYDALASRRTVETRRPPTRAADYQGKQPGRVA